MKIIKKVLMGIVILFIFLGILGTILSKQQDKKMAGELLAQGKELMSSGEYLEASETFSKSLIYIENEEVEKLKEKAQDLHKVNTFFNNGVESFKNNKYQDAIEKLKKVTKIDKEKYRLAQEKIKESKELLANEYLNKAKEFYSQKKYIEAFKYLQDALNNNYNLEDAKNLKNDYKKKSDELSAKLQKEKDIEKMKAIETGEGSVAIGVDVKISKTFNDGYTTYSSKDGKSHFVKIFVHAENTGSDSTHINPNYFTLSTPGGHTVNVDNVTYSLSNYLDAIDIGANKYTTGWLIFFAPKADYYKLEYNSLDSSVTKKIVY